LAAKNAATSNLAKTRGNRKNIMATKKAFWDTKNPNKKSVPLTSAQKASAKTRAKKAGRPYPNLVDNAAAKRG